ncbi:ankyrin repeat domain-containing protein [Xenophilus arseniciresistens]|uniref:Ankyrin repeat domain-containing protein n=1 Tax=Xenophilus arseniciresistens TaxID=1283306 RepID=A0AAE3NE56_9BURK|nr:ankyrin repeat domain-containing protein [Xenophilus arseniciresistens]MDA7417959.1 ankyrin repeat domain-containing protein [Xenophilus arseniciresistens]
MSLKPASLLAAALVAVSCATTAGPREDFFRAVAADNPYAVRSQIERGMDPNTLDDKKQTALVIALREGSPKVARALIEIKKTDVNATNGSDESPLMMAALRGQQEFVDLLLKRDAAVNKTGWAPLHYAATAGQVGIMKQLLDQHAFIDAQSPNGTTPLMMAAMYGSADAVKLLLAEGADIMMKNEQGLSALDFARRANRTDAMELLSAAATRAPQRPGTGKW